MRRGAIVTSNYMATADALLRKRDYLGLLAVSNRHGEAIARVVQKTLDFMTKNPGADFAQAREIAETEGTRVATNLHNRVTYLADIATIGPLVGLFGTVIGIIRSFGALGSERPVRPATFFSPKASARRSSTLAAASGSASPRWSFMLFSAGAPRD